MLLAYAAAVVHAAAVLFMLTGSDCPLTAWELELRRRAGHPGYTGGFIGHYITDPLGFPIHATSTQVGIYVLAFLPNLIGYGLLVTRQLRSRALSRSRA